VSTGGRRAVCTIRSPVPSLPSGSEAVGAPNSVRLYAFLHRYEPFEQGWTRLNFALQSPLVLRNSGLQRLRNASAQNVPKSSPPARRQISGLQTASGFARWNLGGFWTSTARAVDGPCCVTLPLRCAANRFDSDFEWNVQVVQTGRRWRCHLILHVRHRRAPGPDSNPMEIPWEQSERTSGGRTTGETHSRARLSLCRQPTTADSNQVSNAFLRFMQLCAIPRPDMNVYKKHH
jgi:hypothetical protein